MWIIIYYCEKKTLLVARSLKRKSLNFLDMTNKDLWGMISQVEKYFGENSFFVAKMRNQKSN